MKTHINHTIRSICFLMTTVLLLFGLTCVNAQYITGNNPIDEGTTHTYTLNTQGNSLSNVQWYVGSGGQQISSNPSSIQVKALTGDNFSISAQYTGGNGYTQLFINVNPSGPTPPSTPPTPSVAKFCDYTRLTRATPPSGVTYFWQSSSGGTSTSSSASYVDRVNGSVYYLRARDNSSLLWSNNSASVSYTIDYAPSQPLAVSINNQCGSTVLTRQDPPPSSNVTYYWQSSATGTSTSLSGYSVTRTSGTVYYLRARSNEATACWGPALTINYTINNGPATPTAPTVQSNNCGSTILSRGTPPSGVTWYWQSSPTGSSTSNSSATITRTSGTVYYLRARNNSSLCWSTNSSSVNYSVDSPPATPAAPTVSQMNCDNTILARSNPPSGVTWYWQSSPTGTSTTNSSATVTRINGTVYYLRAKLNGSNCWSDNAASVTYSINYSPSAPLTPTITNNCGSTTLTRDDPNPTADVTWYWQSTESGTSTANSAQSVSFSSGTVYYLKARNNTSGCWGPARTINYTIDNGPVTPSAPTIQSNNCGNTVLSRGTPPSGVTWFWQSSASATSTSNSSATITLSSGTVHYLRARDNTTLCWSTNSSSVNYSINTPPPTPAAPTILEMNCDSTVLSHSNAPAGITWYWQSSSSGTSTADANQTITKINGTVQYLRAQNNTTGCWSDDVSSVTYSINYSPSAPLSPTITNNCGSTTLTRDDPNPTDNVTWYWQSIESGTSTANSAQSVTLTGGTVYYLKAQNNTSGCWGPARTINYTIDPGPDWYLDADGDNYAVSTTTSCTSPGTGYTQTVMPLTDCNDGDATINPDTVWYLDADGDNFAVSTTVNCTNPGSGYTLTVLPLTDCNDSNPNFTEAKVYYEDADGDLLGDPMSPSEPTCTQPSGYVANSNDACPTIDSQDNSCMAPADPSDLNYVYTRAYQEESTAAVDPGFFTVNDTLIQQISYFDGLGRGAQQIGIAQTPLGKDIVTHMAYDDYGRMDKEYLPYAETDTGIGTFRTGAQSSTIGFYNQPIYDNTANPFSEKDFEKSPLNRVKRQAAPGTSWAMGSNNEVKFDYETNTAADGVRLYEVSLSLIDSLYVPSLVWNSNLYANGTLYKNVTKDENWKAADGKNRTVEEFTDIRDRVVLKRTYADMDLDEDGTIEAGETELPHDTYYVYDDHGNLSFVLPPLVEPSSAILDSVQARIPGLGYRYLYDKRNRLAVKKLPGKGEEHIVYNTLDQPILTQDSIQRISGEWLFTKYDAFGRVAYTGKVIDSGGRYAIQDTVNGLTTELWVNQSGTALTIGSGLDTVYYNNVAWPTSGITEILTINYYDNYDTNRSGTAESVTSFGVASTDAVRGLATESRVKVLGVSPAQWITTVTYYDKKARPLYTYSENEYLGTVDIVTSELDFTGRVLKTKSSHTRGSTTVTTLDNFTYDHAGRLLAQTQCIGDETMGEVCPGASPVLPDPTFDAVVSSSRTDIATNSITLSDGFHVTAGSSLTYLAKIDPNAASTVGEQELIVLNTYDELGRLESKKVGGDVSTAVEDSPGLQTIDYTYNVRGWLRQINDPASLGSDLFGFKINYDNVSHGATALYNGNIAETEWITANDNVLRWYGYGYDALNRITVATDGSINADYSLVGVTYDKNGNILTLERNGHLTSAANSFGQMDDLVYLYSGNQLMRVTDQSLVNQGFNDQNTNDDDYRYDVNGNLLMDRNAYIGDASNAGIAYNHLNLPVEITVSGGGNNGTIDYIYDATGVKLQKVTTDGSSVTTDYAGNFVYENGSLAFFSHPEGYVFKEGTGDYRYVYQYRDHLDNIRLSYTEDPSNPGEPTIIEENNYYPFGGRHQGYNNGGDTALGNDLAQMWKFGGKELDESFGLETYDFGARNYDPWIGRWMNIDPLAEQMRRHSPYNYAFDNPIFFIDPDGMAPFRVIAKDKQSQENIRNQLRKEDRQYVEFDENGELNADKLSQASSDSGNLKNLKTLANSETTYAFSSSDSYEYKDADTGETISGELVSSESKTGTKGITLFPEKVGENKQLSTDSNVNIVVNNKSSDKETAKTTAHEIAHGAAYDKGENPNHQYDIVGEDKDGAFIIGDKNKNLDKEIKARIKETEENYNNRN